MKKTTLTEFKEKLHRQGFEQKAVVSDQEMDLATRAFDDQEGIVDTPTEELRYIEGLLNLPLGYIEQFRVVPAEGHERCACGRTPSALDIIHTALRKQIHDKELVRDTLIGFSNIIELSENGRTAECFNCSRLISSRSYWTRNYMYA